MGAFCKSATLGHANVSSLSISAKITDIQVKNTKITFTD
jgi:hypothetical protein